MGRPEIRFKGYTDEWEQRKLDDWGTFLLWKKLSKVVCNRGCNYSLYKIWGTLYKIWGEDR